MTSARARDRRVYLGSHPVLFALLAAARGRPVRRLGGTLIVNSPPAFRAALTQIPLDRTAPGTTGGAVDTLAGAGGLFDQQGDAHRRTRRRVADGLGAAGVERLHPVWTAILEARLAPLAAGATIDLVPLATEIAGATAAALLEVVTDPFALAAAAQEAGASAARAHLPGLFRRPPSVGRLLALVAAAPAPGLAATLAVAAVTTTVAALPRAVAWVCDDELWASAGESALVDELFRVTSPTPLLPRVAAADGWLPDSAAADSSLRGSAAADSSLRGSAAADGSLRGSAAAARGERPGGCPVRAGDRMVLIARHAADAHRRDPDPARPAGAQTAQLVFGTGPHACPGARLARRQLGDLLAALAPYRPVVVRARVDRRSALPGWKTLTVRATA